MQNYYYSIYEEDGDDDEVGSMIIVGQEFYDKFGHISDQTSAHYTDEVDEYNECAYTEDEETDDCWGLKYMDREFLELYDEWYKRFGVGEQCESMWDATPEFIAYLEAHPNFTEKKLTF